MLDTEDGRLEGHDACAEYLYRKVQELLCNPANLDSNAQNSLLSLVSTVFTDRDNQMLEALPTPQELLTVLSSSNLKASAGSDGIGSLVYKECWDSLGDSLFEVIKALFEGSPLPASMRTAMMHFCSKPKKVNSCNPSDKRRISILKCDFKLYEGLLARRFRSIGSRVLSPLQYVAGKNRTIHHGIARARDAIEAASRSKLECGIGDQDYIAAFDFLVLSWVWQVLEQKGVNEATTDRLRKLYANGITVPVVNNTPLPAIFDIRGSLRQGGTGSMEWFAFGIDPLLIFLELNLSGILVSSVPVLGPVLEGESFPLPKKEERFKAMAFCDDVKPAICNIQEFHIADRGASLFEQAAGTRLHRDPLSQKCKFLPLGKWRRTLKQEDIPTPYMRLTDTLDMVGVQLCDLWSTTRRKNGDILQQRIKNLIGSWRTGKFMPLCLRPYSSNTFALSKVWFRCSTVNLRESDFTAINTSIKKWLYADLLLKPEEIALFRPVSLGGLGLTSVKLKSTAFLIRTFLELAANPKYFQSQYLNLLYRVHILGEDISNPPLLPPYYNVTFFSTICQAKDSGCDIINMTTKQWYNYLLDLNILKLTHEDGSVSNRVCRVERLWPDLDWESTWTRIKLPSLPNDTTSFLWKLMHDLLTTEERVNATVGNASASCRFGCGVVADLEHCFFGCCLTNDVGNWLLSLVRKFEPTNEANILKLKTPSNDALDWIIAITLHLIWSSRVASKKANLQQCVAHLKAEAEIMKNTKFNELAEEITGIIS